MWTPEETAKKEAQIENMRERIRKLEGWGARQTTTTTEDPYTAEASYPVYETYDTKYDEYDQYDDDDDDDDDDWAPDSDQNRMPESVGGSNPMAGLMGGMNLSPGEVAGQVVNSLGTAQIAIAAMKNLL